MKPVPLFILVIALSPLGITAQPDPTGPSTLSADQWREDIAFVAEHLIEHHVNPFHSVSETAFRSAVAELRASVTASTDAQIVMELSRLVASIGDAHTYLIFPSDGPLAFHPLPVRFEWLEDGLLIGAATNAHRHLVGARVVSIGGVPALDAARRAGQFLYRENTMTSRIGAQRVLEQAEALHAIGIGNDPSAATLNVVHPDGTKETVTVSALRAAPDRYVRPHEVADVPPPLTLRHRDLNYWFAYQPQHDAWYVQFNVCRDAEDESIAEFAQRLGDSLQARRAADIILDVRWNVGGNSAATVPLVRTLVAHRERHPGQRLFVVTGRWSLSATIVFLGNVTRLLHPILVGEPTGARPNLYGENPFRVAAPHSGLEITWATQYFQPFGPDPQPEAVMPHVAAPARVEDIVAGRDPAMEAIAEYEPFDLNAALRSAYREGGIDAVIEVYERFRDDPRYAYQRPFNLVRRVGRDIGRENAAEGLRVYQLLLRDYPERVRSHELIGSSLEDLGRTPDAIMHYREALARLATDRTLSRPLAYALRQFLENRLDTLVNR